MLDDLEQLKADMEQFRLGALRFADFSPNNTASASYALSQAMGPLWPDVSSRAALLAERAVKLCEGIAALKDHGGTPSTTL